MQILSRIAIVAVAAVAITLGSATPASAQATRTWVSGVGDDVNPCSRTAPCKTFAGAISKTAPGGEITCLDPGGFGAITITRSITIDCTGTQGSILAVGTTGVIVNAANVNVLLRNIQIQGANTATGNGVRVIQARNVILDNVTISNFSGTGTNGRGVSIETATANVGVQVINSRILNVNNFGIHSNPSAGNVVLEVSRTHILRGGNSAIALINATAAAISDSVMSQNVGAGVALQNANTSAQLTNNVISFNGFGVANGLGGASTMRLYGNSLFGNTVGVRIDAGSVFTYGNNGIRGNSGNETPTQPSTGTQ
ncbi:MAG TPA: right-handed parallel beta-helix repeat-containing protein [Allosphingosinicella sp.]|nr:right-handed parallel beta-helix repeat-containing protein [Allosphingosinicella sp.]